MPWAVGLFLGLLAEVRALTVHATTRAVLIGVSGYPTLDAGMRLEGPLHDVPRIRQVLMGRGLAADDITVLADQVPGAGAPTRANILNTLDALQMATRRGDIVILYYVGHGSRQPAEAAPLAATSSSPLGWNSTILPIDIGHWDGRFQQVENAIRDEELRVRVDQLTKKGAFVWAIFDACYSAGLVRGRAPAAVGTLQYHYVEPGALGVPTPASTVPTSRVDAASGGASEPSSAAFFYAAQADEVTPDLFLPSGDPHAQRHGLFSYVLARVLETNLPMTYRQLSEMMLAQYADLGGVRVTPLFTGNGLDQPLLGQRAALVQQWPLSHEATLTVPVGTLSDVNEGAVFGVYPGPLASAGAVLGYVQVTRAEPAYSELKPAAFASLPEPGMASLKSGQYTRLVQSPPRFALRVAVDAQRCESPCRVGVALQQLRSTGIPGVDVQWVTGAEHPDVIIDVRADRLRFLAPETPHQANDKAPGIVELPEGGALIEKITDTLHDIARSRNLMRLASRVALRAPPDDGLATVTHLPAAHRIAQAISADVVPILHDGDRLSITLHNNRRVALDVTLLWADSQYGVNTLFPNRRGDTNRIGAGASVVVDDIHIASDSTAGREHLLLIAIAARRLAERIDLSFLDQPRLALTRDRQHDESMDLLPFLDAGFASYRSRGAPLPAAPTSDTIMQVFTVDVQP
jgi:hypothetical protein